MDIKTAKEYSYDDLRNIYRDYLKTTNIKSSTVQTAYNDAFYLWKHSGYDVFWRVIENDDFEIIAKSELKKALIKNSSGNINSNINGYMHHLRDFRKFIFNEKKSKMNITSNTDKESKVPRPSPEQVEYYLNAWNNLENYHLQEDALEKLFFSLCPENKDISSILLKVAALNDFYSTNIYSVYPVAKHILAIKNIDSRLKSGDTNLVLDIQKVVINGAEKNFYSFASKYCSHHNPLDFPIYDSYVEKVLCYFRNLDKFSRFKNKDLKDYNRFKEILIEFRKFYKLEKYNLKEIDKYIWQLGKQYFPKNYGKKKATAKY